MRSYPYDLPWNPNRLEQREGRVDRYGQHAKVVKTIRYFSPDSAVDGVVIEVLLNKAREIHQALGTHVPVPEESESVTEAVLNALFLRGRRDAADSEQLALGLEVPQVISFHHRWDLDVERERTNRTRFAQRALKPDEVRRELEATDAVLGDPKAVREFVLGAAQRLGLSISSEKRAEVYRMVVGPEVRVALPAAITSALPELVTGFTKGGKSRVPDWLTDVEALRLLAEALPDANMSMAEKKELTAAALKAWPQVEAPLRGRIEVRAAELEKSHRRVRQAVALRVRQLTVDPQFPPDLLGLLVLQPLVDSKPASSP